MFKTNTLINLYTYWDTVTPIAFVECDYKNHSLGDFPSGPIQITISDQQYNVMIPEDASLETIVERINTEAPGMQAKIRAINCDPDLQNYGLGHSLTEDGFSTCHLSPGCTLDDFNPGYVTQAYLLQIHAPEGFTLEGWDEVPMLVPLENNECTDQYI